MAHQSATIRLRSVMIVLRLLVEVEPPLAQQLLGDRVERAGRDPLGQPESGEPPTEFAGSFAREREDQGVGDVGGCRWRSDRRPGG